DTIIVDIPARFEKRDAVIEFIYKDDLSKTLTSYAVNINYSFGEKMGKAGLNTLLGMGTVFIVLILLSLLISCFGFINKAQMAAEKKKLYEEEKMTPVNASPVAAAAVQQDGDDDEIAAVIAAAIAAYQADSTVSAANADGYYVRSIRRRTNNKWNRN
ncbi:MAG: OadG family protein, partial [Lachnospiraceae bacterium]|nr:OadG family protein [Lachnospiraceae bacterium]